MVVEFRNSLGVFRFVEPGFFGLDGFNGEDWFGFSLADFSYDSQ